MKLFALRVDRTRCRGEDGLTLNELLIAMVISAIIVVPLTSAIYTSLHASSSTMGKTRQSVAANLLSSYFGTDVQNAVQVGTNVTESSVVCGAAARPVALLLTTSPGNSSISYFQGSTPATAKFLYRRTCAVGAGGTGAANPPIPVIRDASAATFACVPSCGDTVWQSVTASVSQTDALNPVAYVARVQASRRVS